MNAMMQCKVAYQLEQAPESQLVLEMHKKRRIIQHALKDTKVVSILPDIPT
jgi:hypothetical protein